MEVVILARFTGYPNGRKTEFKPGPADVDEGYFKSTLEPKGFARLPKAKKSAPDAE